MTLEDSAMLLVILGTAAIIVPILIFGGMLVTPWEHTFARKISSRRDHVVIAGLLLMATGFLLVVAGLIVLS